jgi:hypothetical protein
VVSVTDPYGRILGLPDRKRGAHMKLIIYNPKKTATVPNSNEICIPVISVLPKCNFDEKCLQVFGSQHKAQLIHSLY